MNGSSRAWFVFVLAAVLMSQAGCAMLLFPLLAAGALGSAAVSTVHHKTVVMPTLEARREFPAGHDHAELPPVLLELSLPDAEADEAWERAAVWIGHYSALKLDTATDTHLRTRPSRSEDPKWKLRPWGFSLDLPEPGTTGMGYEVRRGQGTDGAETFRVYCGLSSGLPSHFLEEEEQRELGQFQQKLSGGWIDMNCHQLAWFMKTGEASHSLVPDARQP